MGIELLVSVLGAAISLLAGSLTTTEIVQRLVRKLLGREEEKQPSYSERLAELTNSLTRSSKQVDTVLAELAHVAKERENAVRELETNLVSLEGREQDLKKRIDDLQKVPLPAIEHFAKLLESGEKRSALA
jgi:chromosome segregation ATPase